MITSAVMPKVSRGYPRPASQHSIHPTRERLAIYPSYCDVSPAAQILYFTSITSHYMHRGATKRMNFEIDVLEKIAPNLKEKRG